MPFYEYECQSCKYYTEIMQKISDAPLVKCPSCGKRTLKKLVSAPVFRLKGSGWYETDFKSDKENKRNLVGAEKEETKAEAKPEATTDAKADAKGESKADAKDKSAAAGADKKTAAEAKETKRPAAAAPAARRRAGVSAKGSRSARPRRALRSRSGRR